MPKRRRLATGIYADAHGVSVIYYVYGERREKRFDLDDPIDRLIRWRTRQIAAGQESAPREARGTLARDCVRFLKSRKGLANYITEKANLKAWVRALDNPNRWRITPEHIEQTLARWRQEGYSEQTLRHRYRILRQVFRTLDGRRSATPFDDIPLPKKPRPRPVSVSETVVREVATELLKHEILKRLKSGKTRARYLVLASTGRRPAEVKRARPEDVDLHRRLWFVRTAKGGASTILHLNDDMRAAWQLFADERAWGAFDTRNFGRVLHRCGWPKEIRCYNLRHSVGLALSERGADLGDIQVHLGHTSLDTTRQYYVPAIDARRMITSTLLEGRLGTPNAAGFFPRPPTKDSRGTRTKAEEFRGDSQATGTDPKRASRPPIRRKA